MGGKTTPAVGFALGLERLIALREQAGVQAPSRSPLAYVVATHDALDRHALALAERLRGQRPEWPIMVHIGGGSMKSRMKKADRSGARVALILGVDEHASGTVALKALRSDEEQEICRQDSVLDLLARYQA